MTAPASTSATRVMVCFGTRPELIKLAPVIHELEMSPAFKAIKVNTAQHREMLDQMLTTFDIRPDIDLDLMRSRQSLPYLTGAIVQSMADVLDRVAAQGMLVQGDTTTAMCAALAAFYADVPVGHVEAGLRTGNPRAPFPEEINRRIISSLATWHFCPTRSSAENLLREGIPEEQIEITGNTVVDALNWVVEHHMPTFSDDMRRHEHSLRKRILVTLHRRETQGEPQRRLCRCLAEVCRMRDDVELVFPIHLSPDVRAAVFPELDDLANAHLLDPLEYVEFVRMMASAYVIVTDSGGIQEEAPALNVPVLVLRDETERPEGVEAGCTRLCGTDPAVLREELLRLLDEPAAHAAMIGVENPYGDGRSAGRITARLAADVRQASVFPDRDSSHGAPVGLRVGRPLQP